MVVACLIAGVSRVHRSARTRTLSVTTIYIVKYKIS